MSLVRRTPRMGYRDGVLEVRVHVDEVQSKGAKVPVEHG
jgi:hypothetical protein